MTVREQGGERRRPWAHYTRCPGTVEFVGRFPAQDLADPFLSGPAEARHLNIGAINIARLAAVQASSRLRGERQPFSSRRIRLRWAVRPPLERGRGHVRLILLDEGLRTFLIESDDVSAASASEFAADLALHDWLLSTLSEQVALALAGDRRGSEYVLAKLRPALENLVHLWMPGARVDDALGELWAGFERRSKFDEQWHATVSRARDYVTMSVAAGLLHPPSISADHAGSAVPEAMKP